MEYIINYITQWLTWIADRIIDWLTGIYSYFTEWIYATFQKMFAWFNEVFAVFFTFLDGVVQKLTNLFELIMNSIQTFVNSIWTKFKEMTTVVMDSIRQFVTNSWSALKAFIQQMTYEVTAWFDSLAYGVIQLIESGLTVITDLVESAKNQLIKWSDAVLRNIEDIYNEILERLNVGINTLIGGAGSLIESIESRLSQLKEAFGEMATEIVGAISGTANDVLSPIRDTLDNLFASMVEWTDPIETDAVLTEMKKASWGELTGVQMREFFQKLITTVLPQSQFWRAVFLSICAIAGTIPMLLQLGGIAGSVAVQEVAKQMPYAIFTPADVTGAWRRGLVSEAYAIDTIQRQGYSEENASIVLQLSDMVPQEGDLLHLWHRGLLSEKTVDTAFHQQGYNKEYTEAIKTASNLIPPIADLITMAVREAFSPEIAERFGQYEDYPPDLTEWAGKQALSEEWSKRYWAAHWALPSPYQGFEMLHRGIINEKDLDLLLRALDVMPFWRDRLTKIAYTPYTRVDIRRMHKLGVLTEEDVLRSYKDIGYSADKAKTMTDFVMRLNAPPNADDETELKSISRSSIVNFYLDGLIHRNNAQELLQELGYSEDASNLYLDSADLDDERKERKKEVSLILDLTKVGVITFVEAEDRLNALGLEANEIGKAIADILREQAKTTKLPSRSEAEKMYKVGIIDVEEYKDLLKVMGYSSKWQDAFTALLGKT